MSSISVLDLVSIENSEIKYKINNYPDGQQDIVITSTIKSSSGLIKSRFNSFRDLELIICATKALRNIGIKDISLYAPYLIGGRSDRKFVEGGVNYLRDVIAPIINSMNYTSVTVLDPHSPIADAVINNMVPLNNFSLVKFALNDIYKS